MNFFSVFSFANILLCGAVTSYSDLKHRKIYNASIAQGYVCGFLILAIFYGRYFDSAYLAKVFINGSIGMVLSYLLWFYKRWSAGDAKLFSFFSFFLPLTYYRNSYIAFFPSMNILLNVFTIVILYICVELLMCLTMRLRAKDIVFTPPRIQRRDVTEFLKVISSYVFIAFLLSRLSRIAVLSSVFHNKLVGFFIMFLLYRRVSANRAIASILSFCSLISVVFLAAFDTDALWAIWAIFSKVVLYVIVIRALLALFDWYIDNNETLSVKVKDLKAGQVLVKRETQKVKRLVETKGAQNEYHETRNYGLNARQIRIIQSLYKQDDILVTYKTFYLGPLLLAGVLITVLTSNSLIRILLDTLGGF